MTRGVDFGNKSLFERGQEQSGVAVPSVSFTAKDKLACVARELALRRNVYPKWVASGRMKQAAADHEIAVLSAVVADYQQQVEWAADKTRPF